MYDYSVKIVWDEIKRQQNIAKHGMNFAGLDEAFFDRAVVRTSIRRRSIAIGIFEGAVIVAVVYRPLGSEALSVISMRRASRKERRLL